MRSRETRLRPGSCARCAARRSWTPSPSRATNGRPMALELPSDLVEVAVRQAGGPDDAPGLAPVESLGAHAVLRYATGEEAETYRRIMRVLSLEHQAFGLRLRPPQIADRLRERYALNLDP